MNESLTAILADDEALLSYQLNRMLADVWPELDIKDTVSDGEEALGSIIEKNPDVVFLDIRMPRLDGIELANRLMQLEHPPYIVFVTAYDEYAVNAFEANALDYLLKPITLERLAKCVEKVKDRLKRDRNGGEQNYLNELALQLKQITTQSSKTPLKWLRVLNRDEIELIHMSDVQYFKAEDKYITVYKKEVGKTKSYLIRGCLRDLIEQLDPDDFWQIHRSIVVRVSEIEKVKKEITGKMYVLISGNKLPVSRAMQSKFLQNKK
ncbi:LytR/AlgR family response regulator transcription factor [Vibrio spartinae]|uniref:Transcriptional regulatory protein YehT n=1 Tax=Vibrio spartinae TaxID=1918945 RepID=A0A1N6M5N0_9VIBR|nr:LytTR family DNA-binding domain-containing protein [Vibrio spartinae]SIO94751.1 Transcriptional regulatory protein YehT [Vibrio spartinae]